MLNFHEFLLWWQIKWDLKAVMRHASILFKVGWHNQISKVPPVYYKYRFFCAVQRWDDTKEDHTRYDSHLVAALGVHWAHAVTIRLVLESKSGWYYTCYFWKILRAWPTIKLESTFNVHAIRIKCKKTDCPMSLTCH